MQLCMSPNPVIYTDFGVSGALRQLEGKIYE